MEKLIFDKSEDGRTGYSLPKLDVEKKYNLSDKFKRKNAARLPEVSEIEVARHFQRLSHLNFNIEKGMYPLGSCTMKYNPKINEVTASLPGFSGLHPLMNEDYSQGALQVMYELGECLKEISGLPGVSLQPAAGSQGELTAIYLFKKYFEDRNDVKRDTILIPDAAHGTNPASAAIAGFKVETVKSRPDGRTDIDDLRAKAGDNTAAFMLTNPNTVGLFEKNIVEVSKIVRQAGGLMYMDGANLNALMSIVRPGDMGFDCMHINLHKTFSTPHGGGGPGAGPICVGNDLIKYLPKPEITMVNDKYRINNELPDSIGKVHSFFGNFGVLVRAYTYIRMNGAKGLKKISEAAVINANYIFSQLKENYMIPYDEHCMHECIISGNKQKEYGVTTRDIAKRLVDYGFHAPTVYFPLVVPEAMLIEPTETENLGNLQGFVNAMNSIAKEAVENPEIVKNAPHTAPLKRLDEALAARNLNVSYQFAD